MCTKLWSAYSDFHAILFSASTLAFRNQRPLTAQRRFTKPALSDFKFISLIDAFPCYNFSTLTTDYIYNAFFSEIGDFMLC